MVAGLHIHSTELRTVQEMFAHCFVKHMDHSLKLYHMMHMPSQCLLEIEGIIFEPKEPMHGTSDS